jgi:hypothetical protein
MSDTMQMQPSLTTTEIMTILGGCKQTLKFVQSSAAYQEIESSERFTTSNDLRLGDAIQSLSEVGQAIANIEFYQNDSQEIEDAFNSTFTA